MKEVTKKLYTNSKENEKGAVPCPYCDTTLFFITEKSECKHLEFICPKCGETFIIDELTKGRPIKDYERGK